MSSLAPRPRPEKGELGARALFDVETSSERILKAAKTLLSRGYRPVIIYAPGFMRKKTGATKGKEPFGARWGLKDVTPETLAADVAFFTRQGMVPGVGLCLGPGRAPGGGWLLDLEGDGIEAEASRLKLFSGELVETIGWSSARGSHQLLQGDPERLAALASALKPFQVADVGNQPGVFHLPDLPGLELRIGGFKPDGVVKQLQSVCPPTPGTDGRPRSWGRGRRLAELPETFYRALEAFAEAAKPKPAPPSDPKTEKANPAHSYLMAAMDNAVGRIEGTGPGARRDAYRDEAFNLARFLHYNERFRIGFTEYELESRLKSACAIGVSPGDPVVAVTVSEAITAGKGAPHDLKPELHLAAQGFVGSVGASPQVSLKNGAPRGGFVGSVGASPQVSPKFEGEPRPMPEATPPTADVVARPTIAVDHELHRVAAETLAVLKTDPALFTRGSVLVRVVHENLDVVKRSGVEFRNAGGMISVAPISEAALTCRLTALADFLTWHKEKDSRSVRPPEVVVRATLENGIFPGVKPLKGLSEVPFPRPDGSIVSGTGYDSATGVFLAPSVDIEALPDAPTQEDARAAAQRLLALVRQFPFASDDDKGVWLSGLLTIIARPAIRGCVPGIAFNANRAGTGKGLLIDILGTIATGRGIACTSYPKDDAEAVKVKVAIGLSATPLVHLDNLNEGQSYGSGPLDSALTSPEINDRILGQSATTGAIELRPCWFLSGNNISPSRDAYRRWLVCNLETDLECPEERADLTITDLLAHVREHRPELVRDALTILKSHALAGRPTGAWAPLGSFEEWDKIVRGAVFFCTGYDANATRKQAAADSPERQDKLRLLEAWRGMPGGMLGGISAGDACKLASEPNGSPVNQDLADALMAFGKDGKLPSVRTVGNKIRAMRGQNVGGLAFHSKGSDKRGSLWMVVKVNPNNPHTINFGGITPSAGDSGDSGDSDSNPSRVRVRKNSDIIMSGDMCLSTLERLEPESPESPESPTDEIDWTCNQPPMKGGP